MTQFQNLYVLNSSTKGKMDDIDLLIVGSDNKSTGGIPRYIPEQLRHLPDHVDVGVHDIGAPEGSGMLWFVKSLLSAFVDFAEFLFQSPPDIVHVHSSQNFSFYRAGVYVLFSKYIRNVPVILHIHGSSFDKFVTTTSVPSKIFQTWVYGASSEIIVLSEYWRNQLAPYVDSNKITILPNAVDPDDYSPKSPDGNLEIVFISNLIERKGVNELVQALNEILDDNFEHSVSIAGKGILSETVESLAEAYDSVDYLGYVSEERKYELLSDSDIYVLPAFAEGLPIAILEAMAGGNAIISTTVGSIPEVIEAESGRLVPPKDVDSLVAELESLLANPELVESMGRRNRELVEERYNWDVVVEQLVERYEENITDE